jgi:hypothetical protein
VAQREAEEDPYFRGVLVSPYERNILVAAVARYVAGVGGDFEWRLRHHLGMIEETAEAD